MDIQNSCSEEIVQKRLVQKGKDPKTENYRKEIVRKKKKEEKKEEKKDKKYLRREFSYSKFQQTILLPENVEKDKISAKVEHGILSIEIPKMKEEEKQKTSKAIEVK